MPNKSNQGLTPSQIDHFIARGFVSIEGAFSRENAQKCCDELWTEIGLSSQDPSSWSEPVIRVMAKSSAPFVEAANGVRLHSAYDSLVGEGRWQTPKGLGTFPIRFPSEAPLNDDGWHIDVSFGDSPDFMEWRANVKSSGRALLMLFLLSDVGRDDAPTRIRVGSHATIARELLPYGDKGASLRQLSLDNYASTAACELALATGEAGTVYLCHPFIVHAAQSHRGRVPRFMAQPPLLPSGEFNPALPPSPVQIAIRNACGIAF